MPRDDRLGGVEVTGGVPRDEGLELRYDGREL